MIGNVRRNIMQCYKNKTYDILKALMNLESGKATTMFVSSIEENI